MYGNASHEKLTDSGDWRENIDLKSHRYMREYVAIGLVFHATLGERAGVWQKGISPKIVDTTHQRNVEQAGLYEEKEYLKIQAQARKESAAIFFRNESRIRPDFH